ncbi:MAG TPA: ATP-binding protein [Candidatus Limnocylindrales bacterium]|nr:ATP-binding protein [Candidatus Limnocylindrales bacterium]
MAPRHLRVGNDANQLADVRAFVRAQVADLGGSRRTAEDLVQAVDEATCNVMVHGYGGSPGEIDVEASRVGDAIQIRLLDRSTPFDPTAAAARTDTSVAPVPKRPGGMGVGIELLRTMTDEVRHHVRPDGGNELTLVRSIDGPAEEG